MGGGIRGRLKTKYLVEDPVPPLVLFQVAESYHPRALCLHLMLYFFNRRTWDKGRSVPDQRVDILLGLGSDQIGEHELRRIGITRFRRHSEHEVDRGLRIQSDDGLHGSSPRFRLGMPDGVIAIISNRPLSSEQPAPGLRKPRDEQLLLGQLSCE